MCHCHSSLSTKFCSDMSLSLNGHCESSLKKEIDMGQVIFILLFTTLFTKQKEFRQNEARVLIYHSGRSQQERYQNNIRTRAYREAPKLT